VGALGGFYVAPLLAAGWWVRRRRAPHERVDRHARARLAQVALHGTHVALVVALAGYAASTYFQSAASLELHAGDSAQLAGTHLAFAGYNVPAAVGAGTQSDVPGAVPAVAVPLQAGGDTLHP